MSQAVAPLTFFFSFLSPYYNIAVGAKQVWVQNQGLPLTICDPDVLFILLLYISFLICKKRDNNSPDFIELLIESTEKMNASDIQ